MRTRRKFYNPKFPLLLLLGIVLAGMTIISLAPRQNQDIRSKAQGIPFCEDKCIGQDRCGNGPPGDSGYNDPCCVTLKQTGDPFACPWPQRGYCTDDQCNAIPEGVNRQRCGGPRHSWCNLCIENGCPGYGGSPPQPTQAGGPTATPRPPRNSPTPTRAPTLIPSSAPTATPYYMPVTATPVPLVTAAPNATPIIIYITATPAPWQIQHPNYQNGSISPTPGNAWGATLQNTLVQAQNWWSTVLQKISEFTTTIAP